MSILLVLAGLSAFVLVNCVVVLFCSHKNLDRAFDILSFAIRLAEQNCNNYNITRKEGSE